ncbi:hypothetical protein [Streptomyces sp. SID1328]|uniref:hypothetical protein n=1 Tax=Streptomyces sp. SID1328 TaxID=2690250 RepID=UPI0019257809|nr:hypothetical protein [Streptomyces sp. SID1328]
MATRKKTPPKPAACPDCHGNGDTTETVHVGARKGRLTENRQAALCLTCLGTGEAPDGQ